MSNKPRKKKKINHEAIYAKASKSLLKNVVAVRLQSQIVGVSNTSLFNSKNSRKLRPDKVLTDALSTVRHKWSIFFGVFCRDQFGKEYSQGSWVASQEIYYHRDLISNTADLLDEVISQANPMHIIDAGWLAAIHGDEVEQKTVDKIFANYGAWDGQSQWEQEKVA
ncbi:MAG: hypothetical protein PF440_10335 [Thiomicrorhabdus sp.]|jgi:hypothetical protein|nr:hypothetical protein [Thiomicrorhabdus sp.]